MVDMVSPAGRPVAVKVYGAPAPPLPTMVAGVIAVPWTAVIATQLAEGACTVPPGQEMSSLEILN